MINIGILICKNSICKKVLVVDFDLIIKKITAIRDVSKMEEILEKIKPVFDIKSRLFKTI